MGEWVEKITWHFLDSRYRISPEMVKNFRLDRHRDIHHSIYESIKRHDFAACQSDYAAMIASYTRVNWSMPVVG